MPLPSVRPHIYRRLRELDVFGRHRLRRVLDALAAVLDAEAHGGGMAQPPACFGLHAALESAEGCRACPVQMLCLHRVAHKALPEAARRINSFSHHRLAPALGVEPNDAQVAQSLARTVGTLRRRDINAKPEPAGVAQPRRDWARRHLREKQRYPLLRQLRPGQRLRREFDGLCHVVTVADGHYLVNGRRYPTLYCAGMAITGKHLSARGTSVNGEPFRPGRLRAMGNWSTMKLFKRSIEDALQR